MSLTTNSSTGTSEALAGWLDIFQLADSALPVGGQSHSFGLETLITDGTLTATSLATLLPDYLLEVSLQEAVFWRGAYAIGAGWQATSVSQWLVLNRRLSALRLARESRAASAAMGRRFLALAADVSQLPTLSRALQATRDAPAECHHVTAFGLTSGVLSLPEDAALMAYLHQSVVGLLAACQKLLPVGQSELARLRWRLKDVLMTVVDQSRARRWQTTPSCVTPSLEVASMRHPGLAVRLFIS